MRKIKEQTSLETKVIKNKFGEIAVDLDKSIHFPLGILGMNAFKEFYLAPCPVKKFNKFLLMQSAQTDDLVFMVLPLDLESQKYIQTKDLDDAFEQVGMKKENSSIMLIAATKEDQDGTKRITVNTRAPVFVDTEKKTAIQYVLQNNEYDVQQFLYK